MYASFFNLRCTPFEDRADPQFFCPNAAVEEALATLEYEVRYGKGTALLIGEAGTGKTLVLRRLVLQRPATDQVVLISIPSCGPMELIREVCKSFGVALPTKYSDERCLGRLRRHIERSAHTGHRSVVILDQAENLPERGFVQLASLSDVQQATDTALAIVLSGQPAVLSAFNGPQFDRLRQRLFGETRLGPLNEDETQVYVRRRLEIAGAGGVELFDPQAIQAIHSAADGIPRLINHLCNAALVAAYGAGVRRVSVELAREIVQRGAGYVRSKPAKTVGTSSSAAITGGPSIAARQYEKGVRSYGGRACATIPPSEGLAERAIGDRDRPFDTSASREARRSTDTVLHELDDDVPDGLPAADTEYGMEAAGASLIAAERLERAAARAERIGASLEASLEKHQAVEKHLASLTAQAERLVHNLSKSTGQAAEASGGLEVRVADVLVEAEARIAQVEVQATRAVEASAEAIEQVEHVERACLRADTLEASLTEFAQSLADKVDRVQSGIAKILDGVDAGEQTCARLERLIAQAQAAEDSEELKERLERLEKLIHQAGETERRLGGVVLDELKERVESLVVRTVNEEIARASEARKELQAATDRGLSVLGDARGDVEKFRESVSSGAREHSAMLEAWFRETRESFQKAVDRLAQEHIGKVDEAARRGEQRLTELRECTAALSTQVEGEIRAAQASAETASRTARARCDEYARTASDEIHDRLATELEEHRQTLEALAGETRGHVAGVRDEVSQIESRSTRLHERVHALKENVGAAAAQVHELDQAVSEKQASLNQSVTLAGSMTDRLSQSLERGEQVAAGMAEQRTQAEGIQRFVAGALVELGTAAERLQGIERQATQVEQLIARLASNRQEAEQTGREVAGILGSSRTTTEALQRLGAQAQESVSRLDSHTAAAGVTQRQLSETTVEARRVLGKLEETAREGDRTSASTREVLERLLQQVTSLTEKADADATELASKSRDASELIGKLGDTAASASTAFERLESCLGQAQQRAGDIQGRCADAAQLVGKLESIQALLEEARELDTAVRRNVDSARQVYGELTTGAADAASRAGRLSELNAAAGGLIEAQTQLQRETDAAATRLVEQTETTTGALEAGERLLREFTAQAEKLHEQFATWRQRASEIEAAVDQATEKPRQIIATAQLQAAQLEQVCGAVRKVFAALSKATLEAREQAQAIEVQAQQTAGQLSELNAESGQSVAVLHQWVEEAVRAQSRLSATLEQSPTIYETHPPQRGSDLPVPSTVGPSSAAAGLVEPGRRSAAAANPSARGASGRTIMPKNGTRAEEIARLIDQAREAATSVEANLS